MNNDKISHLRKDYQQSSLSMSDMSENPFHQFDVWFKAAQAGGIVEPNIMTLATVGTNGMPSARIVLLKEYGEEGFVFYSNYQSRKGQQMQENPQVALLFLWAEMERQVRIEGRVELLNSEQSDRYYQSRPRGSRVGAWASPQSEVITSRKILDEETKKLKQHFKEEKHIPRPPFWGGYKVIPERLEFWQGRANRLHDRILYTQNQKNEWHTERLAP